MKKILMLLMIVGIPQSKAFDLEDYATTLRATRDAHQSADQALALAESALASFIADNSEMIPMGLDTYKAMGQGIQDQECSYQAECFKVRAPAAAKSRIQAVINDPLVRTMHQDPSGLDMILQEVTDFYNGLSADRVNNETLIFSAQPIQVIWNQDIADQLRGWTGTDPFSSTTLDTSAQFNTFITFRDEYLAKLKDWKLSEAPWRSAQAAYAQAIQTYFNHSACSGFEGMKSVDEWVDAGAPDATQ